MGEADFSPGDRAEVRCGFDFSVYEE